VTDVALQAYLEKQIECLRQEVKVQREGDLRALELATSALAVRLESMNLFRQQILEERMLYVRVDTFRWTVGFLVALTGIIVAAVWK